MVVLVQNAGGIFVDQPHFGQDFRPSFLHGKFIAKEACSAQVEKEKNPMDSVVPTSLLCRRAIVFLSDSTSSIFIGGVDPGVAGRAKLEPTAMEDG
jgi:hypothetical protein